jgi:putative ABC transport system substrate-binding protein
MNATHAVLTVILVLGLVAAPLTAGAQPPGKVSRIGYLGNSSLDLERDLDQALRQGLRDLGYVEGQNIVIEYRWAEGKFEQLPGLAAELVRLPVDVIVTAGTPGTLAAMRATSAIPIVVAVSADAVGNKLVTSLARPGGNVTGVSTRTHELDAKRLELLKEALPAIARVAFIWNPANPGNVLGSKETRLAARALGMSLEPVVAVRGPAEFDAAFATITKARPDAMFVIADRFLLSQRARIVDFAARQRLPATYAYSEYVIAGGLMSYSPSFTRLFRHAADFIDKILKGAKPADLPVEQPSQFELVINLKTARALGLTIPQSMLLRADQIIQ